MKKLMLVGFAMALLLSACAHKNCWGHCKRDQATAAKVTIARD